MAVTRTMYVDDTTPQVKGEASDDTGVLDLSGASSLVAEFIGKSFQFSGNATAIQPAEVDGSNSWNWGYPFAAGTAVDHSDRDTHNADTYDVYLKVTWSVGNVQTFGPDTLQIKAAS